MLPPKESVTPEFLQENDGKLVWIRDDYLMMNGIQGEACPTYSFLLHVEEVKKRSRVGGMTFSA